MILVNPTHLKISNLLVTGGNAQAAATMSGYGGFANAVNNAAQTYTQGQIVNQLLSPGTANPYAMTGRQGYIDPSGMPIYGPGL